MKKRILILLLALLMMTAGAVAESAESTETAQTEEDAVVAMVNGEALMNSDYEPVRENYLTSYAALGYDIQDETVSAYLEDLALTAAIQNLLIEQDMRAQGCYDFDEETEKWCAEQGQSAYESALAQVAETLNETLELEDEDETLQKYALQYAELLGVTAQDYIDVYRTQYATMLYYAWLTQDCPVTDEEIQAEYEQQKADSETDIGELTDDLHDEIAYSLYNTRCKEKLSARIEGLSDAAEVTVY